jgi:hypothetical protein
MATIYDGSRVFIANIGQTALAVDQNTFQDKMILGMEARMTAIPLSHGKSTEGVATNWLYQGYQGSDPAYWEDPICGAAHIVEFPLLVREGERITELKLIVDGNNGGAAGANGNVSLYRRQLTTTPPASALVQLIDADPWGQGGPGIGAVIGASGLTIDVASEYEYFIRCLSSTHGGAAFAEIYGVMYISQFHKGT